MSQLLYVDLVKDVDGEVEKVLSRQVEEEVGVGI